MRNVGRLNAYASGSGLKIRTGLEVFKIRTLRVASITSAPTTKTCPLREHEVEDDGAVRTVPGHGVRCLPNYCMHNGAHYIRKDCNSVFISMLNT